MPARSLRLLLPLVLVAAVTACGQSSGRGHAAPTTSATTASARPAPPANWALTGLPMGSARAVPALTIKIDNAPAARPQSGLNSADIVFEALVEGGLTRFTAVFQSHSAAFAGPVRSARPVDGALLRALNGGIFAYSGAANGEIAPAKAYSTAFLLPDDGTGRFFYRAGPHRAPDNLYASTTVLRAVAARRGAPTRLPRQVFAYGPVTPAATPATRATVRIGSRSSALWQRSGSGYLRWENGLPHMLTGGTQVSATNVVILHVRVGHSGIIDAAGNEDPFVMAYGSGAMEVLRNGVVERGSWSRPKVSSPFAFTTPGGKPLTLTPGRTWVELVPVAGGSVAFS